MRTRIIEQTLYLLPTGTMSETKVIYHVDEEETPYLVKVGVPPDSVTLGDLRAVLRQRHNYKYFFKKNMPDIG